MQTQDRLIGQARTTERSLRNEFGTRPSRRLVPRNELQVMVRSPLSLTAFCIAQNLRTLLIRGLSVFTWAIIAFVLELADILAVL